MTNDALSKLLGLADIFNRRAIVQRDGLPFGTRWTDHLLRSFDSAPKPLSITFEASIYLDGYWHDGFIDVDRDGDFRVRLQH